VFASERAIRRQNGNRYNLQMTYSSLSACLHAVSERLDSTRLALGPDATSFVTPCHCRYYSDGIVRFVGPIDPRLTFRSADVTLSVVRPCSLVGLQTTVSHPGMLRRPLLHTWLDVKDGGPDPDPGL